MNPRLSVLRDEFTAKRAELDALDKLAADEKRDLSEQERADYDANVTRMESIGSEIEETTKRQERFDKLASVTASVQGPAYTRSREVVTYEPVTLGEAVKARAMHSLGKIADDDPTLKRTLQHGTSADGTAPVTIEGDLINFVDANRYLTNVVRQIPMPDNHSSTFKRPKVTQHTTVATQGSQGAVLSSQTMTLGSDTITKGTYGGTVAISEQELDWTQPEMLGLVVQDLAQQYAIQTDTAVCTALTGAVTSNKTVTSLTASAATLIANVATASNAVYTAAKQLPDIFYVAPDRWAYLVGLADSTGRPLFPMAGPYNVSGSNSEGVTGFNGFTFLGLKVVVDPNLASNSWGVAVSSLVEVYEQNKGQLQIAAPSTLETVIAYRGYFATNVYTQGINGLTVS